MKRIGAYVLIAFFASAVSLAQRAAQVSGSASQSGSVSTDQPGAQAKTGTSAAAAAKAANGPAASGQIQTGSIIYAELDKSLDAKKAKVGDPVVAKVAQAVLSKGKIVAPKGSKIVGHVTQVQARTKDQAKSQLGIAFDRIVLKDGSQIAVALTVQAVGTGATAAELMQNNNDNSMGGPMTNAGMPGRAGGPPVLGGAASTVDSVSGTAGAATGDVTGIATSSAHVGSSTHVGASSHGVVGLPDITMATQVTGSSQTTVLTSDKRNIKLDSGSELVLRVQ